MKNFGFCSRIVLNEQWIIEEFYDIPRYYGPEFIRFLMSSWDRCKDSYNKQLFDYFTSATTEDQKIRRIEDFIDGFSFRESLGHISRLSNSELLCKFMQYCKRVVEYIFSLYIVSPCNSFYYDQQRKLLIPCNMILMILTNILLQQ